MNSPRVPKTLFQEGRRREGERERKKERERQKEKKERKKIRKRKRGRKKSKKKGGQEGWRQEERERKKKERFSGAQLFSTDYSRVFPVMQNMPTCRKNGMMSLASQVRICVSQASLPSGGFCSARGLQSPVVTPQGLEGSREAEEVRLGEAALPVRLLA